MQLGGDPKPFFVGLRISAAACTPFAHGSTPHASNAGGCHFRHHLRLGSVVALVTRLLATTLTPVVGPFLPS